MTSAADATRAQHTRWTVEHVGPGLATPAPRARVTGELLASLAARLTARDRWLLGMLHDHRMLTTHQVAQLAFGTIGAATHRLLILYRLRVLDRFRPHVPVGSAPLHYLLGPAGAAVLAAERNASIAGLGYRPDHALAIAHSGKLRHTVGVNGFFTALVAHARRSDGHAALEAWWSSGGAPPGGPRSAPTGTDGGASTTTTSTSSSNTIPAPNRYTESPPSSPPTPRLPRPPASTPRSCSSCPALGVSRRCGSA